MRRLLLDAELRDLIYSGCTNAEIVDLARIRRRVDLGEYALMESTKEHSGLCYGRHLARTGRISEFGGGPSWDAVLPRTPSGPQPGPSYTG